MEITPAIMPKAYQDIANHVVRALDEKVTTVQLDIMDGVFVSGKTFPFLEKSTEWEQLLSGDRGLPHWEEIDYELDLMISNPEKSIDQWIALGPKRIIVHLESLADPMKFLEQHQDTRIHIEIGLAINNSTPTSDLFPYLDIIDCVQFMGIEKIGFQGQPFDEEVLKKIAEIKIHNPHITIQIDGAVNNETIEMLEQEGVERVVVGSAFFG